MSQMFICCLNRGTGQVFENMIAVAVSSAAKSPATSTPHASRGAANTSVEMWVIIGFLGLQWDGDRLMPSWSVKAEREVNYRQAKASIESTEWVPRTHSTSAPSSGFAPWRWNSGQLSRCWIKSPMKWLHGFEART